MAQVFDLRTRSNPAVLVAVVVTGEGGRSFGLTGFDTPLCRNASRALARAIDRGATLDGGWLQAADNRALGGDLVASRPIPAVLAYGSPAENADQFFMAAARLGSLETVTLVRTTHPAVAVGGPEA